MGDGVKKSSSSGQIVADPELLSIGAPAGLALGRAVITGSKYYYVKGIVRDVISNPAEYETVKIADKSGNVVGTKSDKLYYKSNEDKSLKSVANPEVGRYMPANSILVYVSNSNSEGNPYIAYPFFPSHFSMPIKPGETVWLLAESTGEDDVTYYWMSRVAGERQTEDLNFTNIDRSDAVRRLTDAFVDGSLSPLSETGDNEAFYAAASSSEKFNAPAMPKSQTVTGLQSTAYAFQKEHVSEPVPRTFKDCSDFLIQGSNNATIQLTTEKFRDEGEIKQNAFLSPTADSSSANKHKPLAGAIDLFVGKEKQRLLSLKGLSDPDSAAAKGSFNTRISPRYPGNQSIENHEASKLDLYKFGEENTEEGNDRPRNVFARLYLGMNASPDKDFEFSNQDFSKDTGSEEKRQINSGASAVLYGNHVRCFAEDSLRMHVYPPSSADVSAGISELPGGSLIDMANDGTITLQSGQGATAAKIILRPNGNIVIKPGDSGVLYLGGDEEQIAVQAVGATVNETPLDGIVKSANPGGPVISTMGGQNFLGPLDPTPDTSTGSTSSKVLITV